MTQHAQDMMTAYPDRNAKGVTPMIAQFLEVKENHADWVLSIVWATLPRCFSKTRLTPPPPLTSHSPSAARLKILTCLCAVFLFMRLNLIFHALFGKGFRVAICEQTESPEEAKRGHKGPLTRDVIVSSPPAHWLKTNSCRRVKTTSLLLAEVKSAGLNDRYALLG